MYQSTLDTLSLLPPTAPSVICCGSAGTLHCRLRALRGVSVLSQWTMSTLANASVDSRGQSCESPSPTMNFLQYMSISLSFTLSLRVCLPTLRGSLLFLTGVVGCLESGDWMVGCMGVMRVLSHISGSRGIQCSAADKMNKQLGSLERRHCVITAIISP